MGFSIMEFQGGEEKYIHYEVLSYALKMSIIKCLC